MASVSRRSSLGAAGLAVLALLVSSQACSDPLDCSELDVELDAVDFAAGAPAEDLVLRARVTEGGQPIAGESVAFSLGVGVQRLGTRTTDQDGVATMELGRRVAADNWIASAALRVDTYIVDVGTTLCPEGGVADFRMEGLPAGVEHEFLP
jgi:hypothetical protein